MKYNMMIYMDTNINKMVISEYFWVTEQSHCALWLLLCLTAFSPPMSWTHQVLTRRKPLLIEILEPSEWATFGVSKSLGVKLVNAICPDLCNKTNQFSRLSMTFVAGESPE